MPAYYNENNPYAAQWLRNLIAAGHIASGDVDERSIEDVSPDDLAGYGQCHFFAGIGGWSYALRLAGVPDDVPVWTGSCPCQPFSVAGKQRGVQDERHLWPVWFRLISQCRPAIIVGEQVASSDARAWLDGVCADLEDADYACAAANLCAAGVGAPHIRQRLYWCARVGLEYSHRKQQHGRGGTRATGRTESANADLACGMANGNSDGREAAPVNELHHAQYHAESRGGAGLLADTGSPRHEGRIYGGAYQERQALHGHAGRDSATGDGWRCDSPWRDASHVFCRDGKWRPIAPEPRFFPLVAGLSPGMGRLRAYGNALVPQVAAAFVRAAYASTPHP